MYCRSVQHSLFLILIAYVHVAVAEYDSITQCAAANPGIPLMTLAECESKCFTGYKQYQKWDVITSIINFVVPLFVLLGNIHFSHFEASIFHVEPLGELKRQGICDWTGWLARKLLNSCSSFFLNYLAVLCHVLGDPIDTIWSLSDKLDAVRLYAERTESCLQDLSTSDRRTVANVMVAFDDFNFGFVDDQCLADILLDIIQSDEPQALRALEACRNANAMLRQTRVQSARRSFLAVVSYAASLFISLDSNRDSGTMSIHVPHTIALRELYYWLIPVITLSAANGAFPTAWTSYAILHPMVDIINSAGFSCKIQPLKSYSGGSYIWRPNKSLRTRSPALTPSLRSRPMLLLQLSFLSVATAWLFSFLVSWYTPTVGLGCRSITELAYFVTWLFSCCMSAILSRMIKKYNLLFAITFAKDALLAIPMVIVLFAAFRGWWNSCQCWSARWTLGFSEAEVPLNITTRESQLNSFYEWMIGSALGIQCALAVVYLVLYRRELHLMYAGHEDVVAYYRR